MLHDSTYIKVPKIVKLIESESRMVVAKIRGRRKWGVANRWA